MTNARRIFHPLNIRLLEEIDRISGEQSIQEAMRWWLRDCGRDVRVEGAALPETGPVVILSNHYGIFDLPIIWANMSRSDVYFFAMRATRRLGRAVAARIFQVYMSQKPSPYLFERIKNNTVYRLREGIDRAEAIRRNRENTTRAARLVSEGGCLILYPTAGTYVDTTIWKHGVGHLVAEIDNPDLRIVFTRIEGSYKRDLFYMLNPYWFFWARKPLTMRLKIHEPIGISEFRNGDTKPKEISIRLRDRYLEIFGGF